jgi:hypothetical protein
MATYDLHRSELNSLLASDHIDPAVRKAIIDYLEDDGLLGSRHSAVSVQEGTHPDHGTQVLLVDTPNATVNTSSDPNLKAIVDLSSGELKVTGGDNLIVATGPQVNLIDLSGSSGNVVVDAEGSDPSHRGGNLFGDGGNYSTMWSGHGDDGWGRDGDWGRHDAGWGRGDNGWSDGRGSDWGRHSDGWGGGDNGWSDGRGGDWGRHNDGWGGGNFETIGGGRHDGWLGGGQTWGDHGQYTTLSGGAGDDRGHHDMHGRRGGYDGGHHEMDGGTTTIVAGTGNETMMGGNGNYLFEIGPHGGNDDIIGGKGNNTVVFDDSATDVRMTTNHGVTTVTFCDTHETVKLTGVQNIVFTDHGK